jgi:hypothetical protein
MHTVEIQATVKDGTIEIPPVHRAELCDRVQDSVCKAVNRAFYVNNSIQ